MSSTRSSSKSLEGKREGEVLATPSKKTTSDGQDETVLYLGLHFLKVTIPKPLCFIGLDPFYPGRPMDKAGWDSFMTEVDYDLKLVEQTFGVDCSERQVRPLCEGYSILYFGTTTTLSSVQQDHILACRGIRITQQKTERVDNCPPDKLPDTKYLMPYFHTNEELCEITRSDLAVKDTVKEFLRSPIGCAHDRSCEFSENSWSERLSFGLEHIYEGKPQFVFAGRWATESWIKFRKIPAKNLFIFKGAPDFLVVTPSVAVDVVVVDREQLEESTQPGVIECKPETYAGGLGQLFSAMMLLAAREVLNHVDDSKSLPTAVSVSGLLLKRKGDCTICNLEMEVCEVPRRDSTTFVYQKVFGGASNENCLVQTLQMVWPKEQ